MTRTTYAQIEARRRATRWSQARLCREAGVNLSTYRAGVAADSRPEPARALQLVLALKTAPLQRPRQPKSRLLPRLWRRAATATHSTAAGSEP